MNEMTTVEADLSAVEGRVVVQIRRVHYEYQGDVDWGKGPLELTFLDGSSVVFDAAGDGYTLKIRKGPWLDPFAEPLSQENREFVEKHGKWTAFDVSHTSPYETFIGTPISDVDAVRDTSGEVVGAAVHWPVGHLRIEVAGDELFVEPIMQ